MCRPQYHLKEGEKTMETEKIAGLVLILVPIFLIAMLSVFEVPIIAALIISIPAVLAGIYVISA